MQITPYNFSVISFSFFLDFWSLSGRFWLCCWLAGLPLAAFLGGAVGGAVQDIVRELQCLEMLPGAQQGGVVNQCVQQLPARANPMTAGHLAWFILLNP